MLNKTESTNPTIPESDDVSASESCENRITGTKGGVTVFESLQEPANNKTERIGRIEKIFFIKFFCNLFTIHNIKIYNKKIHNETLNLLHKHIIIGAKL